MNFILEIYHVRQDGPSNVVYSKNEVFNPENLSSNSYDFMNSFLWLQLNHMTIYDNMTVMHI